MARWARLPARWDDLGSDGVAIETDTDGIYLGDSRYEPPWAELNRRRAVVFVSPSSPSCFQQVALDRPRPMLEFTFDSTRTASDLLFAGVLTRYPAIEWIFTHGGGALPLLADRMELFRTVFQGGDHDVTPVPEWLRGIWYDMAGCPFPHRIPALVAAFGCQRLLYGSDYCWTPATGTTAQIASIDAASQPTAAGAR
jgi:predicted TIM-barrel fold metal-dependent hydrolase